MIAERFAYAAPRTSEEAVQLLAADPARTRVLGGGTWAVPEMNRGESQPRLVIDLRHAGLAGIRAEGDRIHIGATCTYSDLLASDLVGRELPLLQLMAAGVTGGRQIQNQGTIGGSVVAARPQSDAPAAVVALGGEAVIGSSSGERRCAPADLFAGAMQTALLPGEILLRFEFPKREGMACGYYKLKRSASSWPIATAACLLRADGTTLVLGAVAPTPVSVDLTGLAGKRLSDSAVAEAQRLAGEAVREPWGDILAPAEYRAAVAPVVARRALAAALANLNGSRG